LLSGNRDLQGLEYLGSAESLFASFIGLGVWI
jgi:hypothetical protein